VLAIARKEGEKKHKNMYARVVSSPVEREKRIKHYAQAKADVLLIIVNKQAAGEKEGI